MADPSDLGHGKNIKCHVNIIYQLLILIWGSGISFSARAFQKDQKCTGCWTIILFYQSVWLAYFHRFLNNMPIFFNVQQKFSQKKLMVNQTSKYELLNLFFYWSRLGLFSIYQRHITSDSLFGSPCSMFFDQKIPTERIFKTCLNTKPAVHFHCHTKLLKLILVLPNYHHFPE